MRSVARVLAVCCGSATLTACKSQPEPARNTAPALGAIAASVDASRACVAVNTGRAGCRRCSAADPPADQTIHPPIKRSTRRSTPRSTRPSNDPPADQTIHPLFELRVNDTPTPIALSNAVVAASKRVEHGDAKATTGDGCRTLQGLQTQATTMKRPFARRSAFLSADRSEHSSPRRSTGRSGAGRQCFRRRLRHEVHEQGRGRAVDARRRGLSTGARAAELVRGPLSARRWREGEPHDILVGRRGWRRALGYLGGKFGGRRRGRRHEPIRRRLRSATKSYTLWQARPDLTETHWLVYAALRGCASDSNEGLPYSTIRPSDTRHHALDLIRRMSVRDSQVEVAELPRTRARRGPRPLGSRENEC